jgi:hypothetical protein
MNLAPLRVTKPARPDLRNPAREQDWGDFTMRTDHVSTGKFYRLTFNV